MRLGLGLGLANLPILLAQYTVVLDLELAVQVVLHVEHAGRLVKVGVRVRVRVRVMILFGVRVSVRVRARLSGRPPRRRCPPPRRPPAVG